MPNLNLPKENVIGLAFEPVPFLELTNAFIEYAIKYIGKYYIGDKYDLPEPFTEHFGYMWHSRAPREIAYKPSLMSIVVSKKRSAPGHIYRHTLIEQIIRLRLPIDIYGDGSTGYSYDRVKGKFTDFEPYENYLFTVAIENFQCNHYFSEKIMTPMLYNCMPIYLGCKNIDSYLNNILKLTGNVKDDLLLLMKIIHKPYDYYKPPYNENNIKNVNLIENVERLYS